MGKGEFYERKILDAKQNFHGCKNWQGIFEKQQGILGEHGVKGFMYGVCHSFNKATEYGLLNAVEVWTNYPEAYLSALQASGLGNVDFTSRYIVEKKKPFILACNFFVWSTF